MSLCSIYLFDDPFFELALLSPLGIIDPPLFGQLQLFERAESIARGLISRTSWFIHFFFHPLFDEWWNETTNLSSKLKYLFHQTRAYI